MINIKMNRTWISRCIWAKTMLWTRNSMDDLIKGFYFNKLQTISATWKKYHAFKL